MTTLVAQSANAAADTGVRFSRAIVSSNRVSVGRAEVSVSVVSTNVPKENVENMVLGGVRRSWRMLRC